ncbi:MAG TPA: hypothetical protein ENK43_04575 [Planctomycetes bacterium]|nr:hypothetical protein [Planctomycetota bacterium]
MTRLSLFVLVLSLALPQAMGQVERPVSAEAPALLRKLETFQKALEASHDREAHLLRRVTDLERRLNKSEENAARIHDLEARVAENAAGPTLDELVDRVESLESSGGARSALSLGGYFDFNFRNDQAASHPTFSQHRFVLQVASDILEDTITFKAEIEIEGGGAEASFLSDNEIVVEYAELHFHIDRTFNVKVGALLMPFARFNALHDSPLQDLQDRPLVDRRIVPTTWQEAGIGIYGAFDVADWVVDYDIVVTNGFDDDFSATPGGGFRGNRSSFREDNNDSKQILGRIGVHPSFAFLDAAEFGFSFGWGKYDDKDDQDIVMAAFDWFVKKGPFELKGEYVRFELERGPAERAAGAPDGAEGYYVELAFHFFPESWRGTSSFFTDESTFTLVARFGNIDTDTATQAIDRGARGDGFRDDLQRLTFGLNFRPIEKTVMRIEYQIFFEEDGIPDADNDRLVISFATYF